MEPLDYCCAYIFVNLVIRFTNFLVDDASCLDGTAAHGTPLLLSFALQLGIQPDTKENVCPDIFNNLE